jgi:hypothetical protein
MNGASVQDVSLRFPSPEYLLPRSRYQDQSIMSTQFSSLSPIEKIYKFCLDLRGVLDIMLNESTQRHIWSDPIFPGLHIAPILGDLLVARPHVNEGADIATTSLEAFRLAAILYIYSLRSKFGIDALSIASRYAAKLRNLLSSSLFDQEPTQTLLIWILAVGCTSDCPSEQRVWFGEKLEIVLVSRGITRYHDLIAIISQLVWYEDFLMSETVLKELFRNIQD